MVAIVLRRRRASGRSAMRDIGHRLCGGALIAAAGITTLLHRSVYTASRGGPATVAEFGLALASFVLGCTGVLLVAHGRRLVATPRHAGSHSGGDVRSRMRAPITPAGRADDTRRGAAVMTARHAAAATNGGEP